MTAKEAYRKLREANPELPENARDCTVILEPDSIAVAIVTVDVDVPAGLSLSVSVEQASDDSTPASEHQGGDAT